MELSALQLRIKNLYGTKDAQRGVEGTFLWFTEEVGELAAALREERHGKLPRKELEREFADVLAWLATLANLANIDLGQAVLDKYGADCPGCHKTPCACSLLEKP